MKLKNLILFALSSAAFLTSCDQNENTQSVTDSDLFKSGQAMAQVTAGSLASVDLGAVSSGAALGKWTTDFKAAAQLAAEKKVPMMLYFCASDWNTDCQRLSREAFLKDEWKNYVSERMVLVYIDFKRQIDANSPEVQQEMVQKSELLKTYGINGFPALLMLESDGNILNEVIISFAENGEDLLTQALRGVKRVLRQRNAFIDKMLAEMPEGTGTDAKKGKTRLQAISEEMQKIRTEANEQLGKLSQESYELAATIDNEVTQWLLSKRDAETQARYKAAQTKVSEIQERMNAWLAEKPEQNEQNNMIFTSFKVQIQEQQNIMSDCLAGNE